jgi:plasmid stabilization system protein ParE
MRLAYTETAIADLSRLRAFIAEQDAAAAQRIGSELVERIQHLLDFPHLGKPVELAPDPAIIRDMIFGNYIVRYAVHAQSVVILRVWHHYESRA